MQEVFWCYFCQSGCEKFWLISKQYASSTLTKKDKS